MGDYYIGLISGTSMDGIDAALVNFEDSSLEVLHTHEHDYPSDLRQKLSVAKLDPEIRSFDDIGSLHKAVGECFRDAANALLVGAGVDASAIAAIGSHGQTVRHEPNADRPFSLQIGDPDIISAGTGIPTVADFRSADIELGGQGAPLTPIFHEWLFREQGSNCVVLNIGGIANITVLRGDATETTGFDTGPGNTLLDAWVGRHLERSFDKNGDWASQGVVDDELLLRLLADSYFTAPPPKSTGFEYFNLDWLEKSDVKNRAPADIQATLCELTAISVATAIRELAGDSSTVYVCGGGAHNTDMMRRLAAALPAIGIESTKAAGLDPDWVEAVAFAWLAMRTLHKLPGNLPAVTGARHATILGSIHNVGC